jgi:nucleolar protein 9
MPRENRKRGKKHKAGGTEQVAYEKVNENTYGHLHDVDEPPVHSQALTDAPPFKFGAVDPDVKAYFRTVNDQLRDWQQERPDGEVGAEVDPNEGVQYVVFRKGNVLTRCAFQSAVCSSQQLYRK